MPDLNPQQHMRRQQDLERQSANFRRLWEELQEYIAPWRDPVRTARSAGERQTDRIFDSTAANVANIAAAAVHGMTMPAGTKWFFAKHPDQALRENVPVGQWLEDSTTRVNAGFLDSNLAQESQEAIFDLLVFGTMCLYMELKPPTAEKPFPGYRFRTMPPGSYVAAENADGVIDTIYRKFRLSVDAIFRRWGTESGKEVLDLVKEGKWDSRFTLIHAVYPRPLQDVTVGNDLRVPKTKRPFASDWILAGKSDEFSVGHNPVSASPQGDSTLGQGAHILEKDGLFEFPFMAARWRKMSGETYGRSPGIDSLPDIRTLNQAVEFRLKAWALAIGPPIATSDRGVIGDVRLTPFGRTHVRGDASKAISTIDIGANFNVANFQEEILRAQIQKAFFVDQLNRAESVGKSPKSATEVSINFELMMRILGPVASRLQVEFLAPLVQNGFRMMHRVGGLLEAPDSVLGRNGNIKVGYEGPLARAQSVQEVDAVSRWLQVVLPISEIRPEVLKPVDYAELGRVLAEAVSVPKSVMKSREQVAAETEQEAAAAQAQQESTEALEGAEVLNKVTPAITALS